jgi:hypothetical protein
MPFLLALFACSDLVFTNFLVTLLQRHFLPTGMSYIYSEDDFDASGNFIDSRELGPFMTMLYGKEGVLSLKHVSPRHLMTLKRRVELRYCKD